MDDKYNSNPPISPAEITPLHIYLSRRRFIAGMAVAGAAGLLAACVPASTGSTPTAALPTDLPTGLSDEMGDPANSYAEISNYNNYYEFSMGKESVARLAADFPTTPWEVQVYGLVGKPRTFKIDDILSEFEQEERIYRLRCVEGWSMVIPWTGFSLARLLEQVEPTPEAKYVRFETVLAPDEMPGQNSGLYPFPYQEGLRLDEAMHELTVLATGLYGEPLPPQNGAPIRLVVPWKYGFKSIKGIVKIELVAAQPVTFWNTIAPQEYGFYSNVNPEVSHPRWSQASERRIGENGRRDTLMFNGYADQVAGLYEGLDLKANY